MVSNGVYIYTAPSQTTQPPRRERGRVLTGVLCGTKNSPRGLRLGIIETWDSKWYANEIYAKVAP